MLLLIWKSSRGVFSYDWRRDTNNEVILILSHSKLFYLLMASIKSGNWIVNWRISKANINFWIYWLVTVSKRNWLSIIFYVATKGLIYNNPTKRGLKVENITVYRQILRENLERGTDDQEWRNKVPDLL